MRLFIIFVKRMIMNAEQILKQHGIKKTVCRKCGKNGKIDPLKTEERGQRKTV